jgi:hypothetical protein
MNKELNAIEEELGQIVVNLRLEGLYDEPVSGYLLNAGSPAADFLLESTPSEREFILHKLAPSLVIEDVYEGNHIILNLK